MPHTPLIVIPGGGVGFLAFMSSRLSRIPAKAGIQVLGVFLDPPLRGGDGLSEF